MPQFTEHTDVDIDIDVDEFLDECDKYEIKEVIEWLKNSDYITSDDLVGGILDDGPQSAIEQLFAEDVAKIRRAYFSMSRDDMDIINQIAKKY
jgi:hypothetical protein